jgi:ATP-dependent DNA ligase
MKNCVWLKPALVAQLDFTEWTPDGRLKHSKFVELREDKEARGRYTGRLESRTLSALSRDA